MTRPWQPAFPQAMQRHGGRTRPAAPPAKPAPPSRDTADSDDRPDAPPDPKADPKD